MKGRHCACPLLLSGQWESQISRVGRSGKAQVLSAHGRDPSLRQFLRFSEDHPRPVPHLADSQPYMQGSVLTFFIQKTLRTLQLQVIIWARIQSARAQSRGEGTYSKEVKGDFFFLIKREPGAMPRRTTLSERWLIPSH